MERDHEPEANASKPEQTLAEVFKETTPHHNFLLRTLEWVVCTNNSINTIKSQ